MSNKLKTFSVGDVVRLKSGSPDMVIVHIDDYGAHVVWFDDHECDVKRGEFATAALERVVE